LGIRLALAACSEAHVTPGPVVAVVGAVHNHAYVSSGGEATSVRASAGMELSVGNTLAVAEDSAAAIDFGEGNDAYLDNLTTLTLQWVAGSHPDATFYVMLGAGRFVALMPTSSLVVEIALARLTLTRGAAEFIIDTSSIDQPANSFTFRCLAGSCAVTSREYVGSLAKSEQLVISNSGQILQQTELSQSDVAAILGDRFVGAEAAATMTAWPGAAVTAASSLTPLPPTLAATPRTQLPTTVATSVPTATSTPTRTPTATPTNTPRRPRPTPSPSPTASPAPTSIPPTETPTNQPTPPPPPPHATATSMPPTRVPPAPTAQPSHTPEIPPTNTPFTPPTKTPVM
jgi:hypothetical protein